MSSNNRVLIADDNKESRFILKRILEDYNFIIDEAIDGKEAIEKYDQNEYDLILLDVLMPYKNGDEICKYIKSNQKKYTPVILVTALDEDSPEFSEIYSSQADDVFRKPFNENILMMRVQSYIKLKKYHSELARQKSKAEIELENFKNFSFEILRTIDLGVQLFDKNGIIVFESDSALAIVGSALGLNINDFYKSSKFVTGKSANFNFIDSTGDSTLFLTTKEGKYIEVLKLSLRKNTTNQYGVLSIKEFQQDPQMQKANHNTLKSFLKRF